MDDSGRLESLPPAWRAVDVLPCRLCVSNCRRWEGESRDRGLVPLVTRGNGNIGGVHRVCVPSFFFSGSGVGPCVFAANGCPLLRASCGCQAAVDRCLDVHECSGDVDGAVRVYVRACVVPRVTRVEGPLQQFLDDGIPTWEIVYGQDTATGMKGFWLRVLPESPKCDTMLCKSGLQVACVTRANTRRHCFFFVQLIRAFFHTCTAGYCGRAGPWAVVTPVARLVM